MALGLLALVGCAGAAGTGPVAYLGDPRVAVAEACVQAGNLLLTAAQERQAGRLSDSKAAVVDRLAQVAGPACRAQATDASTLGALQAAIVAAAGGGAGEIR